jgi:Flp pilus assembly protein TadG
MKMGRLKKIVAGTGGSEIAEAAFILPLVFMLLFGVIWFGLAFKLYSTITAAAREGARTAARGACATCTAATGWSGTNLPDDATVQAAVSAVLQAGHVDPANIQVYIPPSMTTPTPCAAPAPAEATSTIGNITIWRSVTLNANISPQQCGVVVSFQYPFGANLPFPSLTTFGQRQIVLSATGQSLMEN